MPDRRQLHRGSTRVFASLMLLIGVGLVVRSLVHGGGPLAYGVVVGVLFALVGAGRLYLLRHSSNG